MTITQDHLQRFCAINDPRTCLLAPMRHDHHTIASNGHILIALANREDIAAEPPPNEIQSFVTRNKAIFDKRSNWQPITGITLPEPIPCPDCQGQGTVHVGPCPDCCGQGQFTHGVHTYECQNCQTGGHIITDNNTDPTQACDGCDATGEKTAAICIFQKASFQRRYLALLQTLPACHISLHPETPADNAAYIRFTGGWGILMPIRI